MRKNYKRFTFREALWKMAQPLRPGDRLRMLENIARYGLYGEEPKLEGLEAAVWEMVKDIIDNRSGWGPGKPRKTGGGDE